MFCWYYVIKDPSKQVWSSLWSNSNSNSKCLEMTEQLNSGEKGSSEMKCLPAQ